MSCDMKSGTKPRVAAWLSLYFSGTRFDLVDNCEITISPLFMDLQQIFTVCDGGVG